jgi:hypothetical protein
MQENTLRRLIFCSCIFIILTYIPAIADQGRENTDTCTYELSTWNVRLKRTNKIVTISHSYSDLTQDEIDPITGCTVCMEDQRLIELPDLKPFPVCYKIANDVHTSLTKLIDDGSTILSIRGYRVIRSRGPIDSQGNRTQFSNHSFGTAIDINRELNGLYDQCHNFGPDCRLVLGGAWNPDVPGTLHSDDSIVLAMKRLGFLWGGEIKGKQKDFMHFSPSGY